jgi:1,4-dihydroxy-2-naphthoate polyprenyltransferase
MAPVSARSAWWLAIRPATLTASAAPVFVGAGAAWADGVFAAGPAIAALVGASLLQVGANFANDVFDFERGADNEDRLGPRWPVLALGLLSIAAAYLYTGGPKPYGYLGLGDLSVFVFFGLGAVAGTYFVQARHVSPLVILASVPIGALATAILVVNNLRDIETDARAGKLTLAVRLGDRATRGYYLALLAVAYVVPPVLWWRGLADAWALLPWLSLPLATGLAGRMRHERGLALNGCLVQTARLEVVFGLLFALGLAL